MSLTTKILIIIGAILGLGALGVIVYQQIEIQKKQTTIDAQIIEQKQLADNIVRSQNEYATKGDVEKFIKDNNLNLQSIKDDLATLNANISAVNTITVRSGGQVAGNLPSTSTGNTNPNPTNSADPDPYGYQKKEQKLSLNEDFSGTKVPFGNVGFSVWQQDPWSIDIKPREYHVTTVVGLDENQRSYFYNKFSVKVDGKDYDVKIASAETKEEKPQAKWSWWNPQVFLGADGGFNVQKIAGEFTPSIGFGFMSWGQFKTQPEISVLQLGIGYGTVSKHVQFVITPLAYNIGKFIPFIHNTYIEPSISISTSGEFTIMSGLRVAL